MLSLRFQNDGKSILSLNEIQIGIKKIIEKKIEAGKYFFKTIDCVVCNSKDFEILSEKDRYGLFMPVVICKCCGLVQTNPRMMESHYLEFYESEYRKLYSSQTTLDSFFKNQYEQGKNIYNFIKETTKNDITGKFVLEIGTGSGGILKFFQEKGNTVLGFDLDEKFLDFGKIKGVNLKKGTIENLSEISQQPDIVIYSHILEHLNNPIKELKTLRKFLNDTSILYIEVPGILNIHRTPYQDFLKYLQNVHLYHFCLNSLHNILKKSGFKLILGTEGCNTVSMKADFSNDFTNEHEKTLNYLLDLESLNLKGFSKNKLKYKLFSKSLKFLDKTKTTSIAKNIINKIDKKKSS
jgi:2-polyprenyl-3-methyl-5-hydroxy-6-metoxy-1,4-benzoquinol methylase